MNIPSTLINCGGAVAVMLACSIASAESVPTAAFQWDEDASLELEHELHRMHDVWNQNKIRTLKELMIGDDELVTFELDPASHQPVRLRSKADIDSFVDQTVAVINKDGGSSELEMPALNCRATATFGVCTEECTVHIKKADGSEFVDELWSTNVAVKTDQGWRWIQWHMSLANHGSGTMQTISGSTTEP